jgi:hypothetical protein
MRPLFGLFGALLTASLFAAPDPGRMSTVRGGPGGSRWRYVPVSILGNVIQAIVVP